MIIYSVGGALQNSSSQELLKKTYGESCMERAASPNKRNEIVKRISIYKAFRRHSLRKTS